MSVTSDKLNEAISQAKLTTIQLKQLRDAIDFASLLKLIELGIYSKDILQEHPKILEKHNNRLFG